MAFSPLYLDTSPKQNSSKTTPFPCLLDSLVFISYPPTCPSNNPVNSSTHPPISPLPLKTLNCLQYPEALKLPSNHHSKI